MPLRLFFSCFRGGFASFRHWPDSSRRSQRFENRRHRRLSDKFSVVSRRQAGQSEVGIDRCNRRAVARPLPDWSSMKKFRKLRAVLASEKSWRDLQLLNRSRLRLNTGQSLFDPECLSDQEDTLQIDLRARICKLKGVDHRFTTVRRNQLLRRPWRSQLNRSALRRQSRRIGPVLRDRGSCQSRAVHQADRC